MAPDTITRSPGAQPRRDRHAGGNHLAEPNLPQPRVRGAVLFFHHEEGVAVRVRSGAQDRRQRHGELPGRGLGLDLERRHHPRLEAPVRVRDRHLDVEDEAARAGRRGKTGDPPGKPLVRVGGGGDGDGLVRRQAPDDHVRCAEQDLDRGGVRDDEAGRAGPHERPDFNQALEQHAVERALQRRVGARVLRFGGQRTRTGLPGKHRLVRRLRRVVVGSGQALALVQALGAVVCLLRLGERRLDFRLLRLHLVHPGVVVTGPEPGELLAPLHPVPFLQRPHPASPVWHLRDLGDVPRDLEGEIDARRGQNRRRIARRARGSSRRRRGDADRRQDRRGGGLVCAAGDQCRGNHGEMGGTARHWSPAAWSRSARAVQNVPRACW